VLLPVAIYALARYRVIAVASVDPGFVRGLLLAVALGSLLLATGLLLAQHDYKRLLAYSSIEHMALAAIGVAIGTPLAIAATLLHIVGHGLGKAVLFCGAGEILAREGTTRIDRVRGLFLRAPVLAGVFAVGLAALLGFPPFSLFASELGLIRAGIGAGLDWVMAAVLVLLLGVFVAVTAKAAGILFGPESTGTPSAALRPSTAAPLVAALVILGVLGLADWPLGPLLDTAGLIVGSR